MSFEILELNIPMCSSVRLAHSVPCASVFRVVQMLIQNILTSLLVSALEPSVIKASGNPMSVANISISKSASYYFSNEQT